MNARETVSIIVRARREGVVLFAKANGKLGLKGDRPPSDELLTILKEHKAEILALLVPPPCASLAVARAKRMIARLQALGFRPYLDDHVLLIADTLPTQPGKKKRDVSRFMPIATVFDEIVTGLADDPGLLDEEG